MPDDVKISEMSEAASLDNSAQFPYVQLMNGNLTTLKAPLSQIGTKINEGMTFSNLQTSSKNIVGAINEVAQGGGVEYATELPISSTDPTDTKSYIDNKTTLVKSASGSLIHITDGGDNIPMKSLVSQIVAVQAGSGVPSPDNVRAISGFDSCVITVTDNDQVTNTYTFAFGQTVYGGQLNVTTGELTITWSGVDLGSLDWIYDTYGTTRFVSTTLASVIKKQTDPFLPAFLLCDIYETVRVEDIYTSRNNIIGCSPSGNLSIKDNRFANANDFKTAVNGHTLAYELETPTTVQLTPTEVKTLSGENNIFSNCGDLDIEYFTESANGLAALIEVLSNS